jgi:hypothetical protein
LTNRHNYGKNTQGKTVGPWMFRNSSISGSAILFLGYLILKNLKKEKKKEKREVEAEVGDRHIFMG